MRRFLSLALLVLVLPGCAAHKVTARDSFFSVEFFGGKNITVLLSEGFSFSGKEAVKTQNGTIKVSTYTRGQEIVLLSPCMALGEASHSAAAFMTQHPATFKYAMLVPSRLPTSSGQFHFLPSVSSGEFLLQDSGRMLKMYVYFPEKGFGEALLVTYCDISKGTDFKAPEYGESLTPDQQAMLEAFSKQADAAFKGIGSAQ